MPGSPPMRTSEPGTTPPPRTRSNSLIPVRTLDTCEVSISSKGTGSLLPAPSPRAAIAVPVSSGKREFQLWHSGHRPSHLAAR